MNLSDAVHDMLANWRWPVDECHAHQLPAVYKRDCKLVWHFPDGTIEAVDIAEEQTLEMLRAALAESGERGAMAERIINRYRAFGR